MTKLELILKVADLCNLPTSQAQAAVNATFDLIRNELIADCEVNLPGFGKFSVKHRAARVGQNPRTAEDIQLPAYKLPYFKASKYFKQTLNSN